ADGHGRGGGVTVAIEIHKHLVARNPKPFPDCLYDAQVRLMRDDTGDVSDGEASLIDRFPGRRQHRGHGLFIDFLTRHVDRLQIQMRVFPRDRRLRSPPGMNKMSVYSPSLPMLVLMTPCALPR